MLRILALLAAGIAVGVCPLNSYARKVTGKISPHYGLPSLKEGRKPKKGQ